MNYLLLHVFKYIKTLVYVFRFIMYYMTILSITSYINNVFLKLMTYRHH